MNKIIILYIILLLLLFTIINNSLNKHENFINIYEILNNGFNSNKIKENNKDICISKKFKNFHNLFLKNIYLSFHEKSKYFEFYMFNYNHKLFMKVNVTKDKKKFDIYGEDNNKIGSLVKRIHNKYIIDLKKLYKHDFIFIINKNYQEIKIYNDFEYNYYYLKKDNNSNNSNNGNNDDNKKHKYKLYIFEEEIGHINNDLQNFKFFIKDKYLDKINLFSYALMFLIIHNKN
jgi:hypothetical protein